MCLTLLAIGATAEIRRFKSAEATILSGLDKRMDALNERVDGIEEKVDFIIKLLQEREGW